MPTSARALCLASLLSFAPRVARADPPARVVAVGDVSLVNPVGSALRHEDFFASVRSTLSGADLTFANLECVMTQGAAREARRAQVTLRAPCEGGRALADVGVDVVSLANNHAFDFGAQGARDTLGCVSDAGLHPIGMADSPAAAQRPYVTVIQGVRVGVLAFAFDTNRRAERPMHVARIDEDPVGAVRALRGSVDVVLVSLHWGVEFTHAPTASQTTLAHALIDAGADAILGHHPHVLQSVEVYRERPIAYSLGNFVFGPQPAPRDQSAVLTLELTRGPSPIARATLTPVVALGHHGTPTLAPGVSGERVRALLRTSSERFHTRLTERAGALEIGLR